MKRQNVDYLLRVGSDEDEERWNGAQAPTVMPGGEGRYKEETARGQPGQGAAAAEGDAAGESSGDGPSTAAAAAASPMGGGNQEGARGSGQDNELQPQEPVQQGMGDDEDGPVPVLLPVPAPVCKRNSRKRFAHWQLQKLESVFQLTHYISAKVRKRLATCMGVSEAKVQEQKRCEHYTTFTP
ncbi:Rhox2d [Phodopus roborovskii]|uniref:Rhox2d protein n=1 Tax=Phodopus roborovskii TaxID=109678 RepID=A0AAU9YYT0_PHORO|nr:Rhox2d [Phodopus roborovskii]